MLYSGDNTNIIPRNIEQDVKGQLKYEKGINLYYLKKVREIISWYLS